MNKLKLKKLIENYRKVIINKIIKFYFIYSY